MATDRPSVVLIVLCILQFRCNNVASSSGDSLDCFNERFNSTKISNTSINGQSELNDFINKLPDNDEDRCIQLSLTGKSYTLDMTNITRMKLGAGGGLVIVSVVNPRVTISIANVSNLEELINSSLVANVSLVVLDGLVFTECPVPVVLEEVSTVIVQNCEFK